MAFLTVGLTLSALLWFISVSVSVSVGIVLRVGDQLTSRMTGLATTLSTIESSFLPFVQPAIYVLLQRHLRYLRLLLQPPQSTLIPWMSVLSEFKQSFRGDIVTPDDEGYTQAIARWSTLTEHNARVVALEHAPPTISASSTPPLESSPLAASAKTLKVNPSGLAAGESSQWSVALASLHSLRSPMPTPNSLPILPTFIRPLSKSKG